MPPGHAGHGLSSLTSDLSRCRFPWVNGLSFTGSGLRLVLQHDARADR